MDGIGVFRRCYNWSFLHPARCPKLRKTPRGVDHKRAMTTTASYEDGQHAEGANRIEARWDVPQESIQARGVGDKPEHGTPIMQHLFMRCL